MAVAPIPPRAIGAARRLVGPARVLGGLLQVLWVTAAGAAAITASGLGVGIRRADAGGIGIAGTVVLAVVLFVPAWWLRHARGTFADLTELPARLEQMNAGGPIPKATRDDLAGLRQGGALKAARTIRSAIGEITDYFSPASTVVEVASPPFWIWTFVATIATGLLVICALVALLSLVV